MQPSTVEGLGRELIRLRKATEAMRNRVARSVGSGMEPGAMSAMFATIHHGPSRSSDLAKVLGLDPSTMSRHVTSLIRAGYVHRIPDQIDGRAQLIAATDEGRAAFGRLVARRNAELHRMLASWTEADVAAFSSQLQRFNDTFDTDATLEGER